LFFWIHSWIWMDGAQAVCIVSTIDRLGKGKRVGALEGFGFQSFPAFKLDFLHIQRKPACGTYTYYSLTRIIIMMLGCCYCVMTTWSLCIVLRSRADRIELPVQRPWLDHIFTFGLSSGMRVCCSWWWNCSSNYIYELSVFGVILTQRARWYGWFHIQQGSKVYII
jgi:hypothetical protein